MSDINKKEGVSSACVVATLFGDEGTALINVQIAPQSIIRDVLDTSFANSFVTPLSNLYVPFVTEGDSFPAFSDKEDLDEFNLVREDDEELDYDEPDGKDFVAITNKQSYNKPRALDYSTVPTIGSTPINDYDLATGNYDDTGLPIRTVGFKLPAFYAGWGIDTVGRPVPSVYDVQKKNELEDLQDLEDSDDKADIEEVQKRKNTYAHNYNINPSNWPAGPIDVRWDRYRGVWAACPVYAEGYLVEDLTEPSGRATGLKCTSGEIVLYAGQYENWEKIQPEQRVWIINRSVGLTASSGTFVSAQYINGEYRPIWIDCAPDPSGSGARADRTKDDEE